MGSLSPASVSLPLQPEQKWNKPTAGNTNGGKTYTPTHPELFTVEFTSDISQGSEADKETYSSRLVAATSFEPNTVITKLSNLSQAEEKAYSSVQYGTGPHDHFELNSDLLFMNHSCTPTIYLDVSPRNPEEWCIRTTERGVKEGEDLTFFYPSTEWDMAQGFDCTCESSKCLGNIRGAKYISLEELESRGFVNEHIRTLKRGQ